MLTDELVTPALLVDAAALDHNLTTMSAALPGAPLRPHVKAQKCTALARRQAAAGHRGFTCASIREVEGNGGGRPGLRPAPRERGCSSPHLTCDRLGIN